MQWIGFTSRTQRGLPGSEPLAGGGAGSCGQEDLLDRLSGAFSVMPAGKRINRQLRIGSRQNDETRGEKMAMIDANVNIWLNST